MRHALDTVSKGATQSAKSRGAERETAGEVPYSVKAYPRTRVDGGGAGDAENQFPSIREEVTAGILNSITPVFHTSNVVVFKRGNAAKMFTGEGNLIYCSEGRESHGMGESLGRRRGVRQRGLRLYAIVFREMLSLAERQGRKQRTAQGRGITGTTACQSLGFRVATP